ncbi:MAG TPA: endolytic transglycosylase MltG [Burkholderiales bacterium]|nr:endolytic transglycosylase MltG [Burkholderiales bacterium]
MWKLLKAAVLLIVLAGVVFGGWMLWFASAPIKQPRPDVEFAIQPGSGLRAAVRQMQAAGLEFSGPSFVLMARALGRAGNIKAGYYALAEGATPLDLLDKITRGDFVQRSILLVEGWTFAQARAALDAHPDVRHDTLGLSDEEVMARIGRPGVLPEGRFFPDTYVFAKGTSDVDILKRAYDSLARHLAQAWEERDADLPLKTEEEALILASIVEKETGRAEDRATIAAVFHNRLRIGMLLQTDPTVIYGMGERFDGNLRRNDLRTDTPYNTYTRRGLPPTPIALPSRAAIDAVMHPADTDALYFVARGDGSSHFSRTLDEHNRAVNRYQRGGRQ